MERGGISKFIGLVLVALAILSYLSGYPWILAALSGVVLLFASSIEGKRQMDLFINTFNESKKIVLMMLFDGLCWGAIVLLGAIVGYLTKAKLAGMFAGGTVTKEAMLNPAIAAQNASAIQSLVWLMIGGTVMFFILSLIIYSVLRLTSWSQLTGQKIAKQDVFAFLKLNAFWWLVLAVPGGLAVAISQKQPAAAFILLSFVFIAAHFTLFIHSFFVKTHKIGLSLGHGIGFGISKLPQVAIPYALCIIPILLLWYLQVALHPLTLPISQIISVIFWLGFFAFVRAYMYSQIVQFKD
ncbi:hypothetical protein J4219_05765 [Candidatus Woesearchaeota archaeon]|nr:hypothetical protein [Candidatus Woesearchaeota archaeon]